MYTYSKYPSEEEMIYNSQSQFPSSEGNGGADPQQK